MVRFVIVAKKAKVVSGARNVHFVASCREAFLCFFQTNMVTKIFYCVFYYLGFLVVAFTVVEVLAVVTFVEEAFLNFFSS